MWDEQTLGLARQVGETLKQRNAMVATAESCTAGLIGGTLTSIPGSGDWFYGGVIAYNVQVKQQILGVPEDVIKQQGVVSEATAAAMAEGALERLGTDWAVAVTGVAGPSSDGEQPVGTVCFGLAQRGEFELTHVYTQTKWFPGERDEVRMAVVRESMAWLLEHLHGQSFVA